jgi:iron complex outermembrane receptor protein
MGQRHAIQSSSTGRAFQIRNLLLRALPLLASPAMAQEEVAPADESGEGIQTAREIVVQGQIGYRNREDAEPILVYDEQYFQRFEPLTAGDALKRVPSVTFLSDVIESDGARLRGLEPGYTQISDQRRKGAGIERRPFLLSRPHPCRAYQAGRDRPVLFGSPHW